MENIENIILLKMRIVSFRLNLELKSIIHIKEEEYFQELLELLGIMYFFKKVRALFNNFHF